MLILNYLSALSVPSVCIGPLNPHCTATKNTAGGLEQPTKSEQMRFDSGMKGLNEVMISINQVEE
mgnify:CR=1 FL=1